MEKKDPSNVSIKNDKGEYEPLQPKHFTGKNGDREFSNLLIQNPEIFPKKWYEPEGSEWMPISVEVNLDTGFLIFLNIKYFSAAHDKIMTSIVATSTR